MGCGSRLLARRIPAIFCLEQFHWGGALLFRKRCQAFPESGLKLSSRVCCEGLSLREKLLAKEGEVLIIAGAGGSTAEAQERRDGEGQWKFL